MQSVVTLPQQSEGSGAWARAFAGLYDPFLWAAERAGVRRHRAELLGRARGRTVEIGCGTGLNLPHYPEPLDELVLIEPDAAMRARLESRVRHCRPSARIVDAPAERLPFADRSVDTLVSTFVLCTVDFPELVLQEIRRVLRPDGHLLYIEHVRSDSPALASWQDRLATPWRHFACGCRCNRATAELMVRCGFHLQPAPDARWLRMPPIVRPLVIGQARKVVGDV